MEQQKQNKQASPQKEKSLLNSVILWAFIIVGLFITVSLAYAIYSVISRGFL